MSIRCIDRVWRESRHEGGALLLLLAIADYADDDGRNAWPSLERLAEKTRMSKRHVRRLLRDLEESGELTADINAGRGNTNVYNVTLKADKSDTKPDTHVPFLGPEKGTSVTQKGTSVTEKGTSVTVKEDMGVPRSVNDPLDPSENQAAAHARAREESPKPAQSDLTPAQELMPLKRSFERTFGRLPTREDVADIRQLNDDIGDVQTTLRAFQEVAQRIRRGSRIARPAAYARHIAQDYLEGGTHGQAQQASHRSAGAQQEKPVVDGWTPDDVQEWRAPEGSTVDLDAIFGTGSGLG